MSPTQAWGPIRKDGSSIDDRRSCRNEVEPKGLFYAVPCELADGLAIERVGGVMNRQHVLRAHGCGECEYVCGAHADLTEWARDADAAYVRDEKVGITERLDRVQ